LSIKIGQCKKNKERHRMKLFITVLSFSFFVNIVHAESIENKYLDMVRTLECDNMVSGTSKLLALAKKIELYQ
tara:strand:+ start:1587 stop:1805 length:219 start_codon:yes stop_codon:yes gene_type:complete